MVFKNLLLEKKDFVAKITINRPEARNAINTETARELNAAFQDVELDDSVGVVVLTGAGDQAFCAGVDVKMVRDLLNNPRLMWKNSGEFMRVVYNIKNTGKPVIARVNGYAIGGGVEYILACDLVVAAENAKLLPGEAMVGATPAGGSTQLLPLVVGLTRAKWSLFTSEWIDAKTACEWGLVNKVVPPEKLDEEVNNLCKRILNNAPFALTTTKTQTNFWFDLAWPTFTNARDLSTFQMTTTEMLEGSSAFKEKRSPQWMRMREQIAAGKVVSYSWGPPVKNCKNCGAGNLPEYHEYCGKCGAKLK